MSRLAALFFGALAGLFLLFLAVGLLLPGTWSATASMEIDAPPDRIFPHLETPRLWEAWIPWPEGEVEVVGPPSGEAAGIRWDDPRYGEGTFRIVESHPPRRMAYQVDVEGGALSISGVLVLEQEGEARTRIRWEESGDFGWNPLLGYVALTMERSQGTQLEESLIRLQEAVTTNAQRRSRARARSSSLESVFFITPSTSFMVSAGPTSEY